jgi:hypothetical protein
MHNISKDSVDKSVEDCMKDSKYVKEISFVQGVDYKKFNDYSRFELIQTIMRYRHMMEEYKK